MGITSLQVCMDSQDWFQDGTISEEGTGMDSSPSGEDNILTCSRPLIERRLRPPHDQSLKCPRCDSTHTKFCYYNNYSLSQPRYFCKTCRRYWTKGGTLRNIPVGGGCRKNKKVSSNSKKSSTPDQHTPSPTPLIHINHHTNVATGMSPPPPPPQPYGNRNPTDLHLAFPEQLQFPGMFNNGGNGNPNFNNFLLDNPNPNPNSNLNPIEFLENRYESLVVGGSDFVGNGDGYGGGIQSANFNGFCTPYSTGGYLEHGSSSAAAGAGGHAFLLPYDQDHHHHHQIDVKPNAKILSLEWHDHQQACNSDTGYNFGGLGSWTGLMNGYGSSAATNPLV